MKVLLLLLLASPLMADEVFYTYWTLRDDINIDLANDLSTKISKPYNKKQPSLNTEVLILGNTNYALIRTDSPKSVLTNAIKIVPLNKTTITDSPRGDGKEVILEDWRTDPVNYFPVPRIAFDKVWEDSASVKAVTP